MVASSSPRRKAPRPEPAVDAGAEADRLKHFFTAVVARTHELAQEETVEESREKEETLRARQMHADLQQWIMSDLGPIIDVLERTAASTGAQEAVNCRYIMNPEDRDQARLEIEWFAEGESRLLQFQFNFKPSFGFARETHTIEVEMRHAPAPLIDRCDFEPVSQAAMARTIGEWMAEAVPQHLGTVAKAIDGRMREIGKRPVSKKIMEIQSAEPKDPASTPRAQRFGFSARNIY